MVDLVEAVGGREQVERCEKRWGGGSAERQAQVFLKENNCEMEMEKSGPREIRSVRDGRRHFAADGTALTSIFQYIPCLHSDYQ